ncbi:MAG: hypothetical protein KBS62_05035 [Oscillospiraceae bacterium]|nr:hypothetical protein [Candidatus Ruminococcus equi]
MNDNELLAFISKNSLMGVIGINSVVPFAKSKGMKRELNNQRKEYGKIYRTASKAIRRNDGEQTRISPYARKMTDMLCSIKLKREHSDSKIAEMMIEGSAMGVTKIIKHKRNYSGKDKRITNLAEKLLKTEENNINNMKAFL